MLAASLDGMKSCRQLKPLLKICEDYVERKIVKGKAAIMPYTYLVSFQRKERTYGKHQGQYCSNGQVQGRIW